MNIQLRNNTSTIFNKESARGILNKKSCFQITKAFIMNMDIFRISILFFVVIVSINVGIFNLFQLLACEP